MVPEPEKCSLPKIPLISRFDDTFTAIFSESAKQIFLRFRELPVPSSDQGRVPCWTFLFSAFFFFAGNVFFRIPLCDSILPEGPRVTEEGYKIRKFCLS